MTETADQSAGEDRNTEETRPGAGGEMTEMRENKDLLSLMESWDVETFLEETDGEQSQCKYFQQTGSCPYQEVGCMFQHHDHDNSQEHGQEQVEEQVEEEVKQENKPRVRERLSARSRNRKINEDRFRRMRDLSISCS